MTAVRDILDTDSTREAIYLAAQALCYMASTPQPLPTDGINVVKKKACEAIITLNNGGIPIPGPFVTKFTANDLPPIFTVTVTNPTTTPNLSFILTAVQQNRVLAGPISGSPAAPIYRALVIADIPNLSSIYQLFSAKLTAIAALPNAAGWLHNDGTGIFSYSNPPGDIPLDPIPPPLITSPGSFPMLAFDNFYLYFYTPSGQWRRIAGGKF